MGASGGKFWTYKTGDLNLVQARIVSTMLRCGLGCQMYRWPRMKSELLELSRGSHYYLTLDDWIESLLKTGFARFYIKVDISKPSCPRIKVYTKMKE